MLQETTQTATFACFFLPFDAADLPEGVKLAAEGTVAVQHRRGDHRWIGEAGPRMAGGRRLSRPSTNVQVAARYSPWRLVTACGGSLRHWCLEPANQLAAA